MSIIAISGKMQSGKNTVASIVQYLTSDDCSKQCLPRLKDGLDIQGFHNSHWKQKAFATKLKQIVSILTGIPVEDLEKQEVKGRLLGKEWWYCQFRDISNGKIWRENLLTHKEIQNYLNTCTNRTVSDGVFKPTVRQLLQEVGTEAMRNVIHTNVWVNALFADYKQIIGYASGNYSCKCGKCNEQFTGDKRALRCEKCSIFYPNWCITDMRFPNELKAVKDRGGITIRVNRPKERQMFLMNAHITIDTRKIEHESEKALDSATFDYVIDNNSDIQSLINKVKSILIKESII